MLIVRAVVASDLEALLELAAGAGSGMTTLKADRRMLAARIATARASFCGSIAPQRRDYLFVMEDSGNGRLAGVCAVRAAVGLDEPFYNYRIGTLVHSSRELKVFSRMETLYLSNDLTGSTELCSLLLHPDYRGGGNGKLLSKSRLLFIASFPALFSERLIAELRGYQGADGSSPFYEGLGRHFFKMSFDQVDDLTTLGRKSFIAELMPRHPLYLAYLPQAARDAVGKVQDATVPARRLLEQEGMHCEGYIDIFDAGPVLQTRISQLRALRDSALVTVASLDGEGAGGGEPLLVANTSLADFRLISVAGRPENGRLALSEEQQRALLCGPGDALRILAVDARRNAGA